MSTKSILAEHLHWTQTLLEEHIRWTQELLEKCVDEETAQGGHESPKAEGTAEEAGDSRDDTNPGEEGATESKTSNGNWIEDHIQKSSQWLEGHVQRARERYENNDK